MQSPTGVACFTNFRGSSPADGGASRIPASAARAVTRDARTPSCLPDPGALFVSEWLDASVRPGVPLGWRSVHWNHRSGNWLGSTLIGSVSANDTDGRVPWRDSQDQRLNRPRHVFLLVMMTETQVVWPIRVMLIFLLCLYGGDTRVIQWLFKSS